MNAAETKEYEALAAETQKELESLAELVGGRAWGVRNGKPRIYMPARKDCKVYFEFGDWPTGDHCDPLGGSALKIYIDDCGQHPKWYASQRNLIFQNHFRESLAIQAFPGHPELAREIMELDEISTSQLDDASGHLLNRREAEARQVLGL